MDTSNKTILETRINELEKEVLNLTKDLKKSTDTLNKISDYLVAQNTELDFCIKNNNNITETLETSNIKLSAILGLLLAIGTFEEEDFKKAFDKAETLVYFSNPEEMVNRFLLNISNEFEKTSNDLRKKERRQKARETKYGKHKNVSKPKAN